MLCGVASCGQLHGSVTALYLPYTFLVVVLFWQLDSYPTVKLPLGGKWGYNLEVLANETIAATFLWDYIHYYDFWLKIQFKVTVSVIMNIHFVTLRMENLNI